ncbi:MAG: SIMPL domain-containing protein [Anaerolineae bacterium]|nr:SIMPL domain-containing protein [Anaerolineae bacterium]
MKHPFRLTRMGALLVVVLISLIALMDGRPARGQGGPNYTITVSGVGTAAGKPDIATVQFGIETINTTLATAFMQAADGIKTITDALTKQNISPADIQTTQITVQPQDRVDPSRGITGNYIFRVRSMIRVTIRDVTQVESIIRAAVDAGANIVDNFTFGIDNLAAVEQQARAAAIKNARDRATQLADALGFAVGDAVIVTETVSNSNFPPTAPIGSVTRGAVADPSNIPVSVGQMIVTVQVQVSFNIRAQK